MKLAIELPCGNLQRRFTDLPDLLWGAYPLKSEYMDTFETIMKRGGSAAIQTAGRFFMKDDPVHQTLNAIVRRLTELQIPYCIAGGMALVAHGYDRTTVDIDIIVTEAG